MAFGITFSKFSCLPSELSAYSSQTVTRLPRQSSESQDPLYRFFMREARVGTKLLSQVQKDLKDLIQVCRGEIKQTNHLRSLMSQLAKGEYFSIELQHALTLR